MPSSEPTSSGIDPDDTQPGCILPQPPPPRRFELPRAWAIDRAARELARLCAGWALRGRSVEDLVGLVSQCCCRPRVFPRCVLSTRVDPGPTLDALCETRTQHGRLAVVESLTHIHSADAAPPRYAEHHILLPKVEVLDSIGHLEPLSTERRALLGRCIEPPPSWLRRLLAKELFDYDTRDALYLSADYLERGGALELHRRDRAYSADQIPLEAADYETMPDKLLCLVRPERIGQKYAAVWFGLEQLGLRLERDSCFEHERLYDEFMTSRT